MSGKYTEVIKKAREPKSQETIQPESQDENVNLCVKVPLSLRRYWMARAKEQGITVTSVIIEALNQKFGKPENQKRES